VARLGRRAAIAPANKGCVVVTVSHVPEGTYVVLVHRGATSDGRINRDLLRHRASKQGFHITPQCVSDREPHAGALDTVDRLDRADRTDSPGASDLAY
jgi:hypothetical protein